MERERKFKRDPFDPSEEKTPRPEKTDLPRQQQRGKKNKTKEKNENQRLKRDFIKANTNEFIEEQARNKLLLVKEGEQKVIIPKELIASQTAQNKITENEPNWRKWWNLFF